MKFRKNPVDIAYLKRQLVHELTEYDKRLQKTQPNLARYGHFLRAADDAFAILN